MSELNVKTRPTQKFVWSTTILLSLMHMVTFYVFYYRIVYGIKLHWWQLVAAITTTFGITAGYHRLWCHKSYTANTPLQILLLIFASSTYQKSCYHWVRDHRTHHMYSETDADPHNATRGFFFSHIGWLFVKKHPEVIEKGKLIDLSDLEANPLVMFQHKYYYYIVMVFAFIIPTYIGHLIGHSWLLAASLTIHRILMGMHLTWSVNSFAHLYGNKPFTKSIGPVENIFVSAATGGEGFHNFHHTFPQDYKANFKHADIKSPATVFIDFFEWIGMATNLKVAPEKSVKSWAEKNGDISEFHKMHTFKANFFVCVVALINAVIMM